MSGRILFFPLQVREDLSMADSFGRATFERSSNECPDAADTVCKEFPRESSSVVVDVSQCVAQMPVAPLVVRP
jgi:hypothetical protein